MAGGLRDEASVAIQELSDEREQVLPGSRVARRLEQAQGLIGEQQERLEEVTEQRDQAVKENAALRSQLAEYLEEDDRESLRMALHLATGLIEDDYARDIYGLLRKAREA